jgi:tRNA threonylcarbamoyladenosine biosynthesis protein TsaE
MMMLYNNLNLRDVENLARDLAAQVSTPTVFCLWGDLGAGKTAFSRAFIQSLTSSDTIVASPTFTLLQTYETNRGTLFHYDLYRMTHTDEIYELNILEAMHHNICLIEWPERLKSHLPSRRTDIKLIILDDDHRNINLSST